MKYLGIDYGTSKIGLSLATDSLAMPWKIIFNVNEGELIAELNEIVRSENIDEIVVGIPWNLKQESTEQTKLVLAFSNLLKKHINKPIREITEVFSTKISQKQGSGKFDDAQAAANILQTYIDKK